MNQVTRLAETSKTLRDVIVVKRQAAHLAKVRLIRVSDLQKLHGNGSAEIC